MGNVIDALVSRTRKLDQKMQQWTTRRCIAPDSAVHYKEYSTLQENYRRAKFELFAATCYVDHLNNMIRDQKELDSLINLQSKLALMKPVKEKVMVNI